MSRRTSLLGAVIPAIIASLTLAASNSADDAALRREIEERLRGDAELAAHSIEVDVEEGVATVEGRVETLADRRRALERAGRVRGVLAIENQLVFSRGSRNDSSIEVEIAGKIRESIRLSSAELVLRVDSGVAEFEGAIRDARDRLSLRRIAESTRGVKEIVLAIETPETDDDVIHNALLNLLAHRVYARLKGEIEPSVAEGVVTLDGSVPRIFERMLAEDLAWGVNGVTEVRNELVVALDARAVPIVYPND